MEQNQNKAKLLHIKNLKKHYLGKKGIDTLFSSAPTKVVKAVDNVTFDIYSGEILGLIGESGSGKTTIGKLIMALEKPDACSQILLDLPELNPPYSQDVALLDQKSKKDYYKKVQMIFQDPFESINPRFTVYETVAELITVQKLAHKKDYHSTIVSVLEYCGLKPALNYLHKYPHQLSGGERQRLSIARALVVNPKMLVADEPVSMLDVSIKAGILNLLKNLSENRHLTILYISHDISTVKYLCSRVIIFYLGKIMEIGDASEVIDNPYHPYSKALKAAIPIPDPSIKRERKLTDDWNEKSSIDNLGCCYYKDCPEAMDICATQEPPLIEMPRSYQKHMVACHLYNT